MVYASWVFKVGGGKTLSLCYKEFDYKKGYRFLGIRVFTLTKLLSTLEGVLRILYLLRGGVCKSKASRHLYTYLMISR